MEGTRDVQAGGWGRLATAIFLQLFKEHHANRSALILCSSVVQELRSACRNYKEAVFGLK